MSQGEDPQFQQRVPLRKIPALVVLPPLAPEGEEVVLYESEVINEWLEEQFPEPAMLPQHPLARAQARLVARFHDLYLEPALRQLYPQVPPATRDVAAVQAAGAAFLQHLTHLDQHLLVPGPCATGPGPGPFAAGQQRLGLADCGFPGLLLYAQLLFPALGLGQLRFKERGLPRVAALHDTLLAAPAVAQVMQELRPAAQQWLDTKLGG